LKSCKLLFLNNAVTPNQAKATKINDVAKPNLKFNKFVRYKLILIMLNCKIHIGNQIAIKLKKPNLRVTLSKEIIEIPIQIANVAIMN
jgi:hypothetical protein